MHSDFHKADFRLLTKPNVVCLHPDNQDVVYVLYKYYSVVCHHVNNHKTGFKKVDKLKSGRSAF
jgi:hypothetical protein